MKANAPTKTTLLISVILAVLAVVGYFGAKVSGKAIPFLTEWGFWFILAAFCLLLAGCLLKKL